MYEEWRPVIGYEKYYIVSNYGKVKRIAGRSHVGKILKPHINEKGYSRLILCVDGKCKGASPHVLVAEAFIGKRPTAAHEVAHFDGNPKNNFVGNIRWATRKENATDRIIHGTNRKGKELPQTKLTENQVKKIVKLRKNGATLLEIARKYGVCMQNISRIMRGQTWQWLTQIKKEPV